MRKTILFGIATAVLFGCVSTAQEDTKSENKEVYKKFDGENRKIEVFISAKDRDLRLTKTGDYSFYKAVGSFIQ